MAAARRFAVGIAVVALLGACSDLAAPPPEATDDDPRSLRATDPAAAGDVPADDAPAVDVPADDAAAVSADPAGTPAEPDDALPGGDDDPVATSSSDEPDADEERATDRPRVHPDQYISRWLDHHVPRASDETWEVTQVGAYEWDLAGVARIVEPDAAHRSELEQVRSELLALPEADRPIDVGYLVVEFDGGFPGVVLHTTSRHDGELTRVMELAGTVMGFVESSYRASIEGVDTIGGVHVFHVEEGVVGGVEARIWRQGPRTVILTGPYGVGLEDIARATITFNG